MAREEPGLTEAFPSPRSDFGLRASPLLKPFRQPLDLSHDIRQRLPLPFGKRIGRVAVGAAQVTRGKPDEDARQPCKGALALQAQIDFIDDQRLGHRLQCKQRTRGKEVTSQRGFRKRRLALSPELPVLCAYRCKGLAYVQAGIRLAAPASRSSPFRMACCLTRLAGWDCTGGEVPRDSMFRETSNASNAQY